MNENLKSIGFILLLIVLLFGGGFFTGRISNGREIRRVETALSTAEERVKRAQVRTGEARAISEQLREKLRAERAAHRRLEDARKVEREIYLSVRESNIEAGKRVERIERITERSEIIVEELREELKKEQN